MLATAVIKLASTEGKQRARLKTDVFIVPHQFLIRVMTGGKPVKFLALGPRVLATCMSDNHVIGMIYGCL